METVTHGAVDHPSGVPFKSTQEVGIYDRRENLVRRETRVCTGNEYELIEWTENEYDENGRLVRTTRSDGGETESEWGCCGKSAETDERGLSRTYGYDPSRGRPRPGRSAGRS